MAQSFTERLEELLGLRAPFERIDWRQRWELGPQKFVRTKLYPFAKEHPIAAGALAVASVPFWPVLGALGAVWADIDTPRAIIGAYQRGKSREMLQHFPMDPFNDPLGRLETRVNPQTGQREVRVPGWFTHPWPLTERLRGLDWRRMTSPQDAALAIAQELADSEADENWITEEEYKRRYREFLMVAVTRRNVEAQIQFRKPDGSVDVLRQTGIEILYSPSTYMSLGLGGLAKGLGLGTRGFVLVASRASSPRLARGALLAARATSQAYRAALIAQFGWETFERVQSWPVVFAVSRGARLLGKVPPFRWLLKLSKAGEITQELRELEQAIEDLFQTGFDMGQVTASQSDRGEYVLFHIPLFRRDAQGNPVPLTQKPDIQNIDRRFVRPLKGQGVIVAHRWRQEPDATVLTIEVPGQHADAVRDAINRRLFGPPPGAAGPQPGAPGPQVPPAPQAAPGPTPPPVAPQAPAAPSVPVAGPQPSQTSPGAAGAHQAAGVPQAGLVAPAPQVGEQLAEEAVAETAEDVTDLVRLAVSEDAVTELQFLERLPAHHLELDYLDVYPSEYKRVPPDFWYGMFESPVRVMDPTGQGTFLAFTPAFITTNLSEEQLQLAEAQLGRLAQRLGGPVRVQVEGRSITLNADLVRRLWGAIEARAHRVADAVERELFLRGGYEHISPVSWTVSLPEFPTPMTFRQLVKGTEELPLELWQTAYRPRVEGPEVREFNYLVHVLPWESENGFTPVVLVREVDERGRLTGRTRFFYHRFTFSNPLDAVRAASRDFLEELQEHNLASWGLIREHLADTAYLARRLFGQDPSGLDSHAVARAAMMAVELRRELTGAIERLRPLMTPEEYRSWVRVREVLELPLEELPGPVREVVERFQRDPEAFQVSSASPSYLQALVDFSRSQRAVETWEQLVPYLTPLGPRELRFPRWDELSLSAVRRAAFRTGDEGLLRLTLRQLQERLQAERSTVMQLLPEAQHNLQVWYNRRLGSQGNPLRGPISVDEWRRLFREFLEPVYKLFSSDSVKQDEGTRQLRHLLERQGYQVRDLGYLQPGVAVAIGDRVHRIGPGLLHTPYLNVLKVLNLLVFPQGLDNRSILNFNLAWRWWIRESYARFLRREPLPEELSSPLSLLERQVSNVRSGSFSAQVAQVVAYLTGFGSRLRKGEAAELVKGLVDDKVRQVQVDPGEGASAVLQGLSPRAESWLRRLAKSDELKVGDEPAILIQEGPKGTFQVSLTRWDEEWLVNFLLVLRRTGLSELEFGRVRIAGSSHRFQILRSILEFAELLDLREVRERLLKRFRKLVPKGDEGPQTYREAWERAQREGEELEEDLVPLEDEETPFVGPRGAEPTPVAAGEGVRVSRELEDPRVLERASLSPADLASGPLAAYFRGQTDPEQILSRYQRSFQRRFGVDPVEVLERTAFGEVGPLVDAVLKSGGTARLSREGLVLERRGERVLVPRLGIGEDIPESALRLLGDELTPAERGAILTKVVQNLRARLGSGTTLEEWEELSLRLLSEDPRVREEALQKLDTLVGVFKTSEAKVLQATGGRTPRHQPLPPMVEATFRHRLAEALERIRSEGVSEAPDLFELFAALRLAREGDTFPLLAVVSRLVPAQVLDPLRQAFRPSRLAVELGEVFARIQERIRTGGSIRRLLEELESPELVGDLLRSARQALRERGDLSADAVESLAERAVEEVLEQAVWKLNALRPLAARLAREVSDLTGTYMARLNELREAEQEAFRRLDSWTQALDPTFRRYLEQIDEGRDLIGEWLKLKRISPETWTEADELILQRVRTLQQERQRLQTELFRVRASADNLGRDLAPWLYDRALELRLGVRQDADFLLRLTAFRDEAEQLLQEVALAQSPARLREAVEQAKELLRRFLPDEALEGLDQALAGEFDQGPLVPIDEEGLLRYLFGADLEQIPAIEALRELEPKRLERLAPPASALAGADGTPGVPEWAREAVWTRFSDLSWDGVVRGPVLTRTTLQNLPPLLRRVHEVLELKAQVVRQLMARSGQRLAELGPGADERARGTAITIAQIGTSVETLIERWWRLAQVFLHREVEESLFRYSVSLGEALGRYRRGETAPLVEFLTRRLLIEPERIQVDGGTVSVLAGNGAVVRFPQKASAWEYARILEELAASDGHLVEFSDLRKVQRDMLWHARGLTKRFLRSPEVPEPEVARAAAQAEAPSGFQTTAKYPNRLEDKAEVMRPREVLEEAVEEAPERLVLQITGDREWADKELIKRVLERFPRDTIVVHGGARGADTLAGEVAQELGMEVRVYPAPWDQYGRAAGPLRNRRMLDQEAPDLVLAFHQDLGKSKGTRDMVQAANEAGFPVLWIRDQKDLADLDELLQTGMLPERAVARVAAVGMGIGEGVERYLRQAAGYVWLQDLVTLIKDALTPIGVLDEATIRALGIDVADPTLAPFFRPPQAGQGEGMLTHPIYGVGQLESAAVELSSPQAGYEFHFEFPLNFQEALRWGTLRYLLGSNAFFQRVPLQGRTVEEVEEELMERYPPPEGLVSLVQYLGGPEVKDIFRITFGERELARAVKYLVEDTQRWYQEELERLSGPLLDRLAELPPEFRRVAAQRVRDRVKALLEGACDVGAQGL